MLKDSKKKIIITGRKAFYGKLEKSLIYDAKPNYIISKLNGTYNYTIYNSNDPYDIYFKFNRTVNFLKLYIKSNGKTRLIYKRIIIFLNLSIPLYFRFWEKKSIAITPESLLIPTNDKLLELQISLKDKNHNVQSILISAGKTSKLINSKNFEKIDVSFKIGKGLKLINIFSLDSNYNKTFIGFRLAIRNDYLFNPKIHPSHSNSFSKWNKLYSQVNSKEPLPSSSLKHAVIIDATNCEYDQLKDCLELYSNQLYKNFRIFLFSECNDIKKKIYDSKVKFVHCIHDFPVEWSRMEKQIFRQYEFCFFTDCETKIPQDFFITINESLKYNEYDFFYFDSVYPNEEKFSYVFRHKFDSVTALQRNPIGSSYVIRTSLLGKSIPFNPHSLREVYKYFIKSKPLIPPEKICHLPLILEEGKKTDCEYSTEKIDFDDFKSLAEQNLEFYSKIGKTSLQPKLPNNLPTISLLVPSAGNSEYLMPFLDSLSKRTKYENYELILTIEENNYKRVESQLNLDKLKFPKFVLVKHKYKVFNFSKIINNALDHCSGDCVCLLNDDLIFTNPSWLSEMTRWLHFRDTGIVGALLLYPNRKIQHAGITLGINRICDHSEKGFKALRCPKTHLATKYPRSVTAVTGACLLARKDTFQNLNGMDENFAEAYNDVDFCLRARELGHNVVLSAKSIIIHHESVNVGQPLSKQRISTFHKEISLFLKKHGEKTCKDEFYPINLSEENPYSELAYPPRNKFHWRKNIPLAAPERLPVCERQTGVPLNLEKVCVFSHFDHDGIIDDYVLNYLHAIKECGWSIVFVTSCGSINKRESRKLEEIVSYLIGTKGEGRDWGNYSIGYARCRKIGIIKNLLLANDSVYGPTTKLSDFFTFSENSQSHAIGMTNSLQFGNHLQSYFILCKEKLCTHNLFDHFWKNFYYQSEKDEIIYKNEIGFSVFLTRYGFNIEAMYDYEKLTKDTIKHKLPGYSLVVKNNFVNPTHHYIHLLLDKYNFPFIKIELLKINPSKVDGIDKVMELIKSRDKGFLNTIKNHLKRFL